MSSASFRLALGVLWGAGLVTVGEASENLANWSSVQTVHVSQAGWNRWVLPLETRSKEDADGHDLRLNDPSGQAVAFLVDQTSAEPAREMPLENLQREMRKHETVITGRIPAELQSLGLTGLTLYSPTTSFLKPVTVEGSSDGSHWRLVTQNNPIYKQPDVVPSTSLEWTRATVAYLRVMIDDTASAAIPVDRIDVLSAARPTQTPESWPATITEMTSDARTTRLSVRLPAEHLLVDSIEIQARDRSFYRSVQVAINGFADGKMEEHAAAGGLIYRVSWKDKTQETSRVPVGQRIPGQDLVLSIDNADSPPLTITGVRVNTVAPVLLFNAAQPGAYTLFVGNPQAERKTYDVAQLRDPAVRLSAHEPTADALEPNPQFQSPPVAPELQMLGGNLDTSDWSYRRMISLTSTPQQPVNRVELDLPAVIHNQGHLNALRLMRDGKQVPYVLEPVAPARGISVALTPLPSKDHISRWSLVLPGAPLLVTDLSVHIADPLFQRTVQLYQDHPDDRGEPVHELIFQTQWAHTPDSTIDHFTLHLNHFMTSTTVTLEIDDGDNAPLPLSDASIWYNAPRLIFPAQPGSPIYMYYGNAQASEPHYDLSLIAQELIAMPPADAKLGSEERLKSSSEFSLSWTSSRARLLFWAVMGLVVVGLLWAIAKLLPEPR